MISYNSRFACNTKRRVHRREDARKDLFEGGGCGMLCCLELMALPMLLWY